MTRKDYILLAKAISDTQDRIRNNVGGDGDYTKCGDQLRGVRRVAAHLADALAADNPRFDAGRFLTACGYGATTMNPSDPALDQCPLPIATSAPASQHYRVEEDEDGDYGIRALTPAMSEALHRRHLADMPKGFFPFSQTRAETETLAAEVAATLTA